MPYIGKEPANSFISFEKQVFTIVNSQTAYTLDNAVTNENDIRLVINNIVQEPGSGKAYTASGTTLTLSAALVNGTDEMYCVFLGKAVQTVNAPNASVGSAQVADSLISGKTALASEPADTDEFLVSDAGTLKRIDYSLIKGGGITMADTWRVNTSFVLNVSPTDLTTNWERADTDSPGYIGTGMSESSGIFTFPQTGIYHIFNQASFYQSGSDTHDWVFMRCMATTDNSSYSEASIGLGHIQNSADEISVCASFIFDVTDTTTHKIKFHVNKQSTNDSVNVGCDSNENRTYATFIRLGDT
jgi:hypothetical protein|tara:strand:- start:123 stop:1025 length:903 start_codon:yes stop_codon:yes gene_type:complete